MIPADVVSRLNLVLPGVTVVRPGSAVDGAHVIVHAPGSGEHRVLGLCGTAADVRELWSCVCVNNTETGALKLARRVEAALNGWTFDGRPVRLITTASAGMDETDPTDWCWTYTVFFSYWRRHV